MQKFLQAIEGVKAAVKNKYSEDVGMLKEVERIIMEIPSNLEKFDKNRQNNQSPDIVKYVVGFLNDPNNQYFYIRNTESFVKYNGINYSRINEDEIWHAVYTYSKGCDPNIKHSIKNAILENIQNKSMLRSIPESKTIQNVINFLYPTILNSKEEAKYFLSIIGDNILKKNKNIIHYFSGDSKSFITALNDNIYDYTNRFSTSSIKWRCYKHNFTDCRILKFNKAVLSNHCWNSFIKNYTLDILTVSTHYSDRYKGSENFIKNNFTDSEVKNHILYLQNKTEMDIVNDFSTSCFNNSTGTVDWEIIYFVWKRYLVQNNFPNFLFIDPLKQYLTKTYQYDTNLNAFKNIGSPFIDKIYKFKTFWKETITECKAAFCEYEIGEICHLYRNWVNNATNLLLNQEIMKTIVMYFYSAKIQDDKYIINIKCSLWCKWLDINKWIQHYKTIYNRDVTKISISNLYKSYCTYQMQSMKDDMQNNSVSKDYFTKYLKSNIPQKYISENLVSHSYFSI